MKVVVTILKDSKDIFRFEAPVHDAFELADVVKLAIDDFVAQHPDISLSDPGVHFTIRDLNEADKT